MKTFSHWIAKSSSDTLGACNSRVAVDYTNRIDILLSVSFLLLVLLFYHELINIKAKTLFSGMLLGAVATLVMTAEITGLKTANASTAFLENSALVFVPAFEVVIRRKFPDKQVIINVIIAIIRIALMTLRGGNINPSTEKFFV